MTTNISVTVPIYTKVGEPLTEQEATLIGLVHLGDATIDVPVDFEQALPFDEIESALNGAGMPTKIDLPTDGCVSEHSPETNPDCIRAPYSGPTLVGDGSGVTLATADIPAPGPTAPEVSDG